MGLDHGIRRAQPECPEWVEDGENEGYWAKYDFWRKSTEIIQWRKENHIHAWFVHNVQNDVDECEDAVVSKEQLKLFVATCAEILNGAKTVPGQIDAGKVSKAGSIGWETIWEDGQVLSEESVALAERLMPTQSGFFFGSTQYSEWYLKSLSDAVDAIEPVLETMAEDDTVVYWSSW